MASRRVAWCDFLLDFELTLSTPVLSDLLAAAPQFDTGTVTRIIGDFSVMIKTITEAEGSAKVDVGIGVVNKEAFDLGTGVGVANPTVEDSTPPRGWLYVLRQVVAQAVPTGAGITAMWRETAHFKFDIRG